MALPLIGHCVCLLLADEGGCLFPWADFALCYACMCVCVCVYGYTSLLVQTYTDKKILYEKLECLTVNQEPLAEGCTNRYNFTSFRPT